MNGEIAQGAQRAKYFFIAVSILEIVTQFDFFQFQYIHNITKPMLMPALALFFYFETKDFNPKNSSNIIYWALFFAWLGDVLLMLVGKNPIYFMLGLGSFLIMQILYTKIFNLFTIRDLITKKAHTISIILFGFFLILYLSPKLGDLRIPVFLYFGAILTMVLSALALWTKHNFGREIFIGALLFMISDSLIAINKFQIKVPFNGFLVMFTYVLAQWLIINGLTKKQITTI